MSEVRKAEPAQQGADWVGEDGYDVESSVPQFQHSSEQAQEPDFSDATAFVAQGDSAPYNTNSAEVDSDRLVAAISQSQVAASTATKPSPQPATKKRKTAGGFLVGDSDSEEDDVATPSSVGLMPGPSTSGQPLARSPLQVSFSAQDNNDPSRPAATFQVNSSTAMPTLPPSGAVLPQDSISILEARVAGDPKGAVDAWLELIGEYRRRNKTDEARGVYIRFLEVFPQSVSLHVQKRVRRIAHTLPGRRMDCIYRDGAGSQ
jgi:cleavage stimulation factor subunit 3